MVVLNEQDYMYKAQDLPVQRDNYRPTTIEYTDIQKQTHQPTGDH